MDEKMLIGMTAPDAGQRVEAYRNISTFYTEAETPVLLSDYMSSTKIKEAFNNLITDLSSQNEEEVSEAARVCVHVLADESFLLPINVSKQTSLYDILMKTLKIHRKNKIITRILQSLAKSRFHKDVYQSNAKENFDALSLVLGCEDLLPLLVIDALQVILVLFNASPVASAELAESWFSVTFSKLFHDHLRVREVAMNVINQITKVLNGMSSDVRSKIVQPVVGDLKKGHYNKSMVKFLYTKHYDILRVWRTIVILFGSQLHEKRHVINSLLQLVGKAFKSVSPEVKVEAFHCWQTLIDNFALSRDTISNLQKLELLISPFKMKNDKTEEVFNMKLVTWWHLICVMSDNDCLVPHFDMIVVPFLNFCFISGPVTEVNKGGISNRNLIMSGVLSSPGRAFSSLYCTSAEILVQLLGVKGGISKRTFSVEVVTKPIMSSTLFLRHYPLFMKCFSEAIQALDFDEEQQNTLGLCLFRSLVTHAKAVIAPDVLKKESVDVVRELFNTLSHIERDSEPESSSGKFLLEFYDILTTGSLALPNKIFNSHQYRISSSGGGGAQDVMFGTLSNHLVTQLCSQTILPFARTNDRFFTVWEAVLENSQPVTGKLVFLEATIQEMSSSPLPYISRDHPTILCRLWGTVLEETLLHIEEAKDDEGEPDWSSIYSVLNFPIVHAPDALACCQVTLYKDIMELWRRLWEKFIPIARGTPTVEPNAEVEEVASNLFSLCQQKGSVEPDVYAPMFFLVTEVLALLTETFAYSQLGKGPVKLSLSPAKPKRKPHRLHNLGTCVEVTAVVFEEVCAMVTRQRNHMADRLCQTVINMMEGILEASMKYVQPFIVYIVKILSRCLRVNPVVVFDFHVEQRFLDMLKSFSELIEAYITREGVTESSLEHLTALESLFTVASTSTNDKVSQEVRKLLNECISSINNVGLEVPSSFLSVQRKWNKTSVNQDSIEDFIDPTPKGWSGRKSRSSQEKSHAGSCRTTSPATKKTNRNKDKASVAGAAGTPSQSSLKVSKSWNENSSSSSSPVPWDVSSVTNEESSDGLSSSSTSEIPHSGSGIKTRKRMNSQQNREGRVKVEPQKKKDKTNPVDDDPPMQIKTESTTSRRSSRITSVKSNQGNTSPVKGEGSKSQDSITTFKKKVHSKPTHHRLSTDKDKDEEAEAQRCAKENDGKNDKDVDDAFPTVEALKDITSSPDQGTSLLKQLQTNILKDLNKTPQADSSARSKRINFMEVSVSPSVVKDAKIVEKKPKVEISFNNESDVTVMESDSENEIPSSLEVNSSISRDSLCPSENASSGKSQFKNMLPVECIDEPMESSAPGGSANSGKRKRKLFDSGEQLRGRSRKKTRMSVKDDCSSKNFDESDLPDLSCDSLESNKLLDGEQLSGNSKKKRRMGGKEESSNKSLDESDLFDVSCDTSASVKKQAADVELVAVKTRKSLVLESKVTSSKPEDSPSKNIDQKKGSVKESKESSVMDIPTETEQKKTKSAFSPKVTRSGRKIVAPNKDMPQPMTPPKASKRRLHQSTSEAGKDSVESLDADFLDLTNSALDCDEPGMPVVITSTDSQTENEKEVERPTTQLTMQKSYKDRREDKARKPKDDSDVVVLLDNDDESSYNVERKTHKAKSSDGQTYTRKGSAGKPSEAKKQSTFKSTDMCAKEKDVPSVVILSSGESVQEVSVEGTNSLERDAQKTQSTLQEIKQESHAPVVSLDDATINSTKPHKPQSDKPVADNEEHQPDIVAVSEQDMNQSSESPGQQKTSDESTPMECGQTLMEEVTYRGSSRGTKALDDNAGNETPLRDKEAATEGKAESQKIDDLSKEAEVKVQAVDPPDTPAGSDKEEKEGDDSTRKDDVEEMNWQECPDSLDANREEDFIIDQETEKDEDKTTDAGQCARTADEEQEPTTEKPQEQTTEKPQEPEERKDKVDQEGDRSDGDMRGEEEAEQEVNSSKVCLSSSEEISSGEKHPQVEEKKDKENEPKEGGDELGEEMEIVSKSAVSNSTPPVEDANARPGTEPEDDGNKQDKEEEEEEPQTTHGDTLDKMQKERAGITKSHKLDTVTPEIASRKEDQVLVSENVSRNEVVNEPDSVAEDLDDIDMAIPKDVPELSVGNNAPDGGKVESQIMPGKEQLESENNDMEIETKEESTDACRRETKISKSSSASPLVPAEGAAPTHKDSSVSLEAGVSSERTDTADGTVSSPGKADKAKAEPRSTVQMKETDAKQKSVSSPTKTVRAMKTNRLSLSKEPTESSSIGNTDNPEEQVEGEPDPRLVQLTERMATETASAPETTTGGSTPVPSEPLEEVVGSRQQEEELSPDKSSRSRLKLTVSTPERLKRRTLMPAGSRAALLVACAKQNIKNRSGGETESPSGVLPESGRSRSLGSSPTRKSVPNRPSPGHSPDSRRRSHLDTPGMRPWMKHSPSPSASPSTSILKKTQLSDGTDGDTPSPPSKYRRVSFADPPVSERVEIPPSPRILRGIRAQKRLDMTRMASPSKDADEQPTENQEPEPEKDPETPDHKKPVYPALLTCSDKVEEVAQYLTSPAIDNVEETLAKMFGSLDQEDEVSCQPNQQDHEPDPAVMAETEVRGENSAKASHSDDIQELMEMEDIRPLDNVVEDSETRAVNNQYLRANDWDIDTRKRILHELLHVMTSDEIAECFAEFLRNRVCNPAPLAASTPVSTTTIATTPSTSTSSTPP